MGATITMSDNMVLMGIPSPGLDYLANSLGIRRVEDAEINKACREPLELGIFAYERIANLFSEQFREHKNKVLIIVYTAPELFLERQIFNAADVLRSEKIDIEIFAAVVLEFWRVYHAALFEQFQNDMESKLIINGDDITDIYSIVDKVDKTFNLELPVEDDTLDGIYYPPQETGRATLYTAIKTLVPDCIEMYGELLTYTTWMKGQQVISGDRTNSTDAVDAKDILELVLERTLIKQIICKNGIRQKNLFDRLQELIEKDEEREIVKKGFLRENGLLLYQLRQLQERLKYYYTLSQKQEHSLEDLWEQVLSLPPVIHRRLIKSRNKTKNTLYLIFIFPILGFISLFKIPVGKKRKLNKQIRTLKQSGLFDINWYFLQYPDVEQQGIDPVEHYLRHGAEEGRDPSANFSTSWYLENNPDVAGAYINPLLHYIQHGREEGRLTVKN